jgi:hypothetical protein
MTHESLVERLWLAMAVAQLWCVSVGCQAEVRLEEEMQQSPPGSALPVRHIASKRRKRDFRQLPPRRLSCVVRGKLELLALLFLAQPFPVGMLQAEVWPQAITAPRKLPVAAGSKKKTQKEKERRKRQKRRVRERSRMAA